MTNTIARKFNHKFGETFKEIKPYVQNPIKVMSLTHPERKMSKSEVGSYISIFDEPEMIEQKLSRAVTATDASAKTMPAGVKNLFGLLKEFGDGKLLDKFNHQYQDGSIKYSELKKSLAQAISKYFEPMRGKKLELLKDQDRVIKLMAEGSKKANKVAEATLQEVKKKVGLI
jgi:tryptophanyl-tRNA synthetase